jgi:benzylsuccinate CoA-transferase BbsF subunit
VLSGIYEITAYEDGTVVGPNTNYPDHSVNPGHALVAIMSAIIHRRKTGRGQYIEVSQLESTVNLLGPQVLAYSLTRVNPTHEGNTSATKAPYGVFPAAGEDRWIAISVATDEQWVGLGSVASDQPWAADSRFASITGRLGASQELNKLVSEWTRGQDANDLMIALQERSVPAGVVQNAKDLVEDDPQLAARGHFVTIDHPEMGPTVYNAAPYTFNGTPGGPRFASPLLGEHNELILQGMLGVSDEEMVRMEAADVFK